MQLKELRQEKGLTQSEVAKAISTSQRNIGRWENGENEPTASFIIQLAKYFNVSADYLLELEDDFGARNTESAMYSSDETRLLEIYRTLSPDMRSTLWSLLETWCPSSTRKNKV